MPSLKPKGETVPEVVGMKIPSFTSLKFVNEDGIGLLELNSPPSNTMSLAFFQEFASVLEFISQQKKLDALVVSGHGRHFSSGADLGSLLAEVTNKSITPVKGQTGEVPDFLSENYRTLLRLEQLRIPVIASIRGVCLGSALELALFSHFRICGEDAVFGLPETSFNLVPGLGGIFKLRYLAGEAGTLELVLKGNTFRAEDALRYGLVDKIVPKRTLLQTAFDFAREVKHDFRIEKRVLYIKKYLS